MNENVQFVEQKRLERVKAALEKNYMQAHIVQTASEVVPLVKTLIEKGSTVANGGSMSIAECGIMELLRSGNYNFIDREAPGADRDEVYRQSFFADTYFASANAVTEQGNIYEMDGNSNRVAAIAYGPTSVILVVGRNKIVADVEAARVRNKHFSAPTNSYRLGCKTPCAVTGICSDCSSPARICCTEMILHQQRIPGRIKVILVNQNLGY